ncbi:MAG: hypothetical protein ABI221_01555 [Candidatus Saccharimonadales bacterium]
MHELGVSNSLWLVGEDWDTCSDLADEVAHHQQSPEQATHTIASIVEVMIGGRELNLADQALPRAAAANHQYGLERKINELPSLWEISGDSRALGVLAILEHKLKRELSIAYTDTLYSQGVLAVDPKTFVAEYLARCGDTATFRDTDRSIKPDISIVVLGENDFVVERAKMVLSWAQKYPNLLPAVWDEWDQPYNVLGETSELDIDLPVELIEPLSDHPNDAVRGRLLITQILTVKQIDKALSLFEEQPYDGGIPKSDLNLDAIVKHQYRLRRARLAANPEEAHHAVQPIEERLGVILELKKNRDEDYRFGRPFDNQRGDNNGFFIQGIVGSNLQLLYNSLDDHLYKIDMVSQEAS